MNKLNYLIEFHCVNIILQKKTQNAKKWLDIIVNLIAGCSPDIITVRCYSGWEPLIMLSFLFALEMITFRGSFEKKDNIEFVHASLHLKKGTKKLGLHIMISHIKRPRMAKNKSMGSLKRTIINWTYSKLQIKDHIYWVLPYKNFKLSIKRGRFKKKLNLLKSQYFRNFRILLQSNSLE
jgi:hypothetical protein